MYPPSPPLPFQWGVVYAFGELVQNPKYALLSRSFSKGIPEIERVYQTLASM